MRKHPAKLSFSFKLPFTERQFRGHWVLLPLFILLQYVFLNLGYWQLDRAEEKRQLLRSYESRQSSPAVPLAENVSTVQDYQPIEFSGFHHQNLQVYMANESNNGRDGYHVYIPVELSGEAIVWVNLGWVQAMPDRRELPEIPTIPEQWQAKGYVYFSKGDPILFDHALMEMNKNQWVIQGRDYERLSEVLGTRKSQSLPFIIRLSPDSEYGFVREWKLISMSPDKHLAYAIQWFGLALALLVLFIALSIKRKEP